MRAPIRFALYPSAGLTRSVAGLAIALASFAAACAPPAPLPALGADAAQVSVSGLSSGAFMAVQMQVAYSRSIVGAGVVAGGPYYCAANNLAYARICMGQVPYVPPNAALMVSAARRFARKGRIDGLSNLAKRRIYVFSGTHDSVVRKPAVYAAVSFFKQAGVRPSHLAYVDDVPAGHALVAPQGGNDCDANAAPYVSHCELDGVPYDQPGAILAHIHGPLQPRVAEPGGELRSFDQRAFAPISTSMADTGYLYVPKACTANGARCRVHVALHGCLQSAESVGEAFYRGAGYNNWADGNAMLVLYPQVDKSESPFNPNGCWDWWGYTGADYAYKSGAQMKAIKAMIDRLAQPR